MKNSLYRLLTAITALTCISLAYPQAELIGPDEFPQFRGVSGLPGGGFPVSPFGGIGLGGAFALSTPIAYHLGHYELYFSGSLLSTDGAIPPFTKNSGGNEFLRSNGTLVQMVGIKAGEVGYLTLGNMIVSTKGDNGSNIHFRFRLPDEKVGLAVGIQDTGGQIGSAGDTFPLEDLELSRSAFVVLTLTPIENTHLSFGTGTRRFHGGFFNASSWIHERIGVFTEYEGKHWNGGVMVGLGDLGFKPFQREAEGFFTFGTVRGKYPYWSIGFAF